MERRYDSTKAEISSPIQTLLSVREFHPVGTMLSIMFTDYTVGTEFHRPQRYYYFILSKDRMHRSASDLFINRIIKLI